MKLTMENIRSFKGLHEIEIKPITLLVGENSTGKSTLMSALSLALDREFPYVPNFNKDPYNLGDFETIATNFGNKDRSDFFSIGFEIDLMNTYHKEYIEWQMKYSSDKFSVPRLSNIFIQSKKGTIEAKYNKSFTECYFEINLNIAGLEIELATKYTVDSGDNLFDSEARFITVINNLIDRKLNDNQEDVEKVISNTYEVGRYIADLIRGMRNYFLKSLSIAPIRVKPKRTYDIGNEIFNPEGEHIPYILSKLIYEGKNKEKLFQSILRFGKESNLFKDLKINRLGKSSKLNDPFQIQIGLSGVARNIIDVGYGLSQSLPILIQSILSDKTQLICLQQPEVHLHPRAQAALGSFFVDVNKIAKKNFVIETHSDYLIDRVRMEVAEKKIKAEDVTILYFEMKKGITKIHPLKLDNLGNITNAPAGYRNFFMEEGLKLLRRGD